MPLTCWFEREKNLVTVVCSGRVSDRLLARWLVRFASIGPVEGRSKLLVDFSGVSDVSQLSGHGIFTAARIRPWRERCWSAMAVVVTSDVQHGLANMFFSYSCDSLDAVQIFRDAAQAWHFLGAAPDEPVALPPPLHVTAGGLGVAIRPGPG